MITIFINNYLFYNYRNKYYTYLLYCFFFSEFYKLEKKINFIKMINNINLIDVIFFYKIILRFFLLYLNLLKKSINSRYGLTFIPSKYKLFTVLRSPHTDKKSREQFHLVKYKSICKYPIIFSAQNSFFFNYFFMDTNIEIQNIESNFFVNL